jgi:hypothetical protein
MLTPVLEPIASLARLDFSPQHRQPPASRVLLATVAAIAGSLAADAILVALGEAVFPGTTGYVHFRFSDYAELTVIGVIIACAAWPIVTRVSSAPGGCSSAWPSWSHWSCGSPTFTSSTAARPATRSPSSFSCTWPSPW